MSISETAFEKVEDAFADMLREWPALAGVSIITEQSIDIASEDDGYDQQIVVFTTNLSQDNSDEHGQTEHTATIEFEVTTSAPTETVGLGRANLRLIADIVECIAQDRTLGGRINDWQEIDIARPATNGKDVSAASLQIRATFFTSRTDWKTLLGQGGLTF